MEVYSGAAQLNNLVYKTLLKLSCCLINIEYTGLKTLCLAYCTFEFIPEGSWNNSSRWLQTNQRADVIAYHSIFTLQKVKKKHRGYLPLQYRLHILWTCWARNHWGISLVHQLCDRSSQCLRTNGNCNKARHSNKMSEAPVQFAWRHLNKIVFAIERFFQIDEGFENGFVIASGKSKSAQEGRLSSPYFG